MSNGKFEVVPSIVASDMSHKALLAEQEQYVVARIAIPDFYKEQARLTVADYFGMGRDLTPDEQRMLDSNPYDKTTVARKATFEDDSPGKTVKIDSVLLAKKRRDDFLKTCENKKFSKISDFLADLFARQKNGNGAHLEAFEFNDNIGFIDYEDGSYKFIRHSDLKTSAKAVWDTTVEDDWDLFDDIAEAVDFVPEGEWMLTEFVKNRDSRKKFIQRCNDSLYSEEDDSALSSQHVDDLVDQIMTEAVPLVDRELDQIDPDSWGK